MLLSSNISESDSSEEQPLLVDRHNIHKEAVWKQYLAAFLGK